MSSPNSIFLDPAEDASDETFYLEAYYAPGHPKFKAGPGSKTVSQLILDVKAPRPEHKNVQWRLNHMRTAVRYFANRLDPLLGKGFAIAIVPSSKSGPNHSGMPDLVKQLAANGRIDASGCLVRHTDISSQHEGGVRSVERHLATIRVDHVELIRGKKVLLLDDVGATGTSLRACKKLLLDAGAAAVKCAALGENSY